MLHKISAGLLMYRRSHNQLEVFLVHPGGPFYAKKDAGVWSIPKGETDGSEELLDVAKREFQEEVGMIPYVKNPIDLKSVKQKSGKTVYAWAFEGDFTGSQHSNTFEMEWPPRSGLMQQFPEVDRCEFFSIEAARAKLIPAQGKFLDRLVEALE